MMAGWRRWLTVCTVALLALAGQAAPSHTYTARGNQLLVDGVPTPLTFARGCDAPALVPGYRALGFNTLLVRIDSPGTLALDQAQALVAAAEAAGLFVLIELNDGDWSDGIPADPQSEDYTANGTYFLEAVLPRFIDSPNLVGWIINTVHEGRLICDADTLAGYLEAKYGTVAAMNEAWSPASGDDTTPSAKANFPSFSVFKTLSEKNLLRLAPNQMIRARMQADFNAHHALFAARDAHFQSYVQERYTSLTELNTRWNMQFATWDDVRVEVVLARQRKRPDSSPLSLLEYARYQATTARALMDWWATELRAKDDARLIFAGGQYSYRSIINLPPSVNGVFVECYPTRAEPDLASHNAHAFDIARRGNRFIVLAGVLTVHDPQAFARFLYTAALHGAMGIGIQDLMTLTSSEPHVNALRAAFADLGSRQALGRTPTPQHAIVYSPYAPGFAARGRPLYGYLPSYFLNGPAALYFAVRDGTCYGQFDYLAVEDLAAVPLTRYRTLLLPTVLDLPPAAQQALQQFVGGGGTVVADLGLGTVQMNGNAMLLPEEMLRLFGVVSRPELKEVRLNMEVYRPHPRFAGLVQGLRTTGLSQGYAITKSTKAVPLAGTELLFQLVASRQLQPPTRPRPYHILPQVPTRGMFVAPFGKGFALYATFPLYQHWSSGAMLFDDFHRELLGADAEVTLQRPIDLLPAMASVAKYADGSVAVWTKDLTAPVVEVRNPDRRAYDVIGGRCDLAGTVTTLRYQEPGYHLANALPIFFGPTSAPISFMASQICKQALVFDLGSSDAQPGPVTLRIGTGTYAVPPGSTHRVTLLTRTSTQDLALTADAQGVLTVAVPQSKCRVLITGPGATLPVQPVPPDDDDPHRVDVIPQLPDVPFVIPEPPASAN